MLICQSKESSLIRPNVSIWQSCEKLACLSSSRGPRQSKSRYLPQYSCVLCGWWQPFTTRKVIQKYDTQSMWSESSWTNVATLGRLHDMRLLLNNCLKSDPKSDPNWKTEQILYTFLLLLMLNRTSIQLFSLLTRRWRIRSFGRRDFDVKV